MTTASGTFDGLGRNNTAYFVRDADFIIPEFVLPPSPAQFIDEKASEPFYRYYARRLHETDWLYWLLYGPLDATNLAYGLFRLSADLSGETAQELHDWISSPEGVVLLGLEIVGLSLLGLMANKYGDDDANVLKRTIAIYYPYLRDALKAKNAFKGVRALLQAMQLLGIVDAKLLLVPLGIFVSAIAILNRLWLRGMIEERKAMMKNNKDLVKEIDALQKLTEAEAAGYWARMQYQSTTLRTKAYLSSGLNGFFDGLYLYFGIIALASVSAVAPPAMIFIAVVSFIFSMSCIASRMYEEWEFQQRLIILQAKIDLALRRKVLQTTLEDLFDNAQQGKDINFLLAQLAQQLEDFQKSRQQLYLASYVSYPAQALAGLKYGLAIYGVFSCLLFTSAVFLTILGLTIPPAMIIGVVILGIVSVLGMVFASMAYHAYHHRSLRQDIWSNNGELLGKLDNLKHMPSLYSNDEAYAIMCSLDAHMKVGESQLWPLKEAAEVGRQGVSALSKGMKITDWVLSSFQDIDAQGNTHDPVFVLMLGATAAAAYSVVLALTAYARAFGRPALGSDAVIGKPATSRYSLFAPTNKIATPPVYMRESPPSSPPVKSKKALSRSSTFDSVLSLLNRKPKNNGLASHCPA